MVTCIRCRDTGGAAGSAAATCSTLAPHSSATAAAHSALVTWWAPQTPSRTSAWASWACSVKRGLANSSSDTGPAQTSPVLSRLTRTTRAAVSLAIAATAGSSALRTTAPECGTACGSSALVCAMTSREPNSPKCAVPTLSTTPIDGGAISASAAMLP